MLELLNAQVDVNNDSISLMNSKQLFFNSKRSLNIVLGTTNAENFDVETTVTFNKLLNVTELLVLAKANNTLLKQQKNYR